MKLTLHYLGRLETGDCKYSIVHNGPIAYIQTTPATARWVLKQLNKTPIPKKVLASH